MPVILNPQSGLSEVLWKFSSLKDRHKRLALTENPHFYERLPILPDAYGGEFRMDPIETFQHERISVLVDKPGLPGSAGRVLLEIAGQTRAFGNVWNLNDRLVFKGSCHSCLFFLSDTLLDVCGSLESESVVGTAIEGVPNLWCSEETRPALSPNQDSPSHTVTASRITSAGGILIRDWREPIRRMLRSWGVDTIRITDKPPSNSGFRTPVSERLELFTNQRRRVTYTRSTDWVTFWP